MGGAGRRVLYVACCCCSCAAEVRHLSQVDTSAPDMSLGSFVHPYHGAGRARVRVCCGCDACTWLRSQWCCDTVMMQLQKLRMADSHTKGQLGMGAKVGGLSTRCACSRIGLDFGVIGRAVGLCCCSQSGCAHTRSGFCNHQELWVWASCTYVAFCSKAASGRSTCRQHKLCTGVFKGPWGAIAYSASFVV